MANLNCFATKENADSGVWFPVKLDGVKLPMALLIYGDDSDVVNEYNRDRLRKIKIGKNGTDIDEDTLEELLDNQDEGILVRIGGVSCYDWKKDERTEEPLELFDKQIKCDKKSYRFLIEQIPALKNFIMEKSNERSNFLSEGKKN